MWYWVHQHFCTGKDIQGDTLIGIYIPELRYVRYMTVSSVCLYSILIVWELEAKQALCRGPSHESSQIQCQYGVCIFTEL